MLAMWRKLGPPVLTERSDGLAVIDADTDKAPQNNPKTIPHNTNQPNIARMSVISAELTKISVNSYITMKISFTNQLRMIAERFPKANIHTILDAIGSDSRIGRKYLPFNNLFERRKFALGVAFYHG